MWLLRLAARTINTDEYGVFRLNDVTISEQFGFLKAEKTGYFPAFANSVFQRKWFKLY